MVCATPAQAHLMNTGFGPFYDGLAHPLVSADDLLPVLALALLAGLGGARLARVVIFALPFAWIVGMLLGGLAGPPGAGPWLAALLTVALGAAVAADRTLSLTAIVVAAAAAGLVHGWENGASLAQTGAGVTGPLGVACTIFVVMTLATGWVVSLRAPWTRIAVRVAGSWIAAIGLLMLGWSVRMSGLHT
jgi:hydrogenase/urease accessory protein HupE